MNNFGRLRLAPLTLYAGAVRAPLRVSRIMRFLNSEIRNPNLMQNVPFCIRVFLPTFS